MSSGRIILVNRYFHPDHSATSQLATDLTVHLAMRGWKVFVIAGRQRYDDPQAALPERDEFRGVRIRRAWSTRFGRHALVGRAVDYLTFALAAFLLIWRNADRNSIVISMTDPPMLSVVAAAAAKLRRSKLVNWLQDLFPEVAEALGVAKRSRGLHRLRDWSLRRAEVNVAVGQRMAERVSNAIVIHNWADAALNPVAPEVNPLRSEWHLGDEFVVGYSGNFGRAHEFETVIEAMRQLPQQRFLFIGDGAQFAAVTHGAGRNVTLVPYQPRENLSRSLSASDAHLVTLRPAVEGLIVPSKFYGVLAVARAVIFVGSGASEIAMLIEQHRCGMVVKSGDTDGLVRAILFLAGNPETAREMGRRGRRLYESRFSPDHALDAWERALEDVAVR